MLGGDSDVRIAHANAVVVHVGKGNDKGKNTEDQNHNSNQDEWFHSGLQNQDLWQEPAQACARAIRSPCEMQWYRKWLLRKSKAKQ